MTWRLETPILLAAALLMAPRPASAQPHTPTTRAVQSAVEHFLDVLGKRELDKLPALFAPKATMAVLRQRDGSGPPASRRSRNGWARCARRPRRRHSGSRSPR